MTLVNQLLGGTADIAMRLLRPLGVTGSLAVVSLATAILVLLVMRATSNQRALAAAKRQIHADLFEIRLFNDDLRAILTAEVSLLRHNATYLRLSLAPMIWMFVPLALLVAQLQPYYGYSGFAVGRPLLVTAQFAGEHQAAALEAPTAIRVETPAVLVPALDQAVWRIVPTAPGDFALQLRIADKTYAKTIHVSEGLARRSPVRVQSGFFQQAAYPSETPLADAGALSSISMAYPEDGIELFGLTLHWIVVYVVMTMVFALVLRRPLHVEM
jgi:uncharacterized membrane protein (DUF106 family)